VLYTLGLLGVAAVFVIVFSVFMRLVIYFSATRAEWLPTATTFAFTLVPIALVYAAAHYWTYLQIQGQGLIPVLADPFARGWDLLPTKGYQASWALAQANLVWYMQVILIVVGHVIAVYLAHLRASERFRLARNALISQYPMLVLMVAYTMTSLWILAQPITEAG
jgi:dipeptide/tripeptide permease